MSNRWCTSPGRATLILLALALVTVRVIVVAGVPFSSFPEAVYDDGLFLRLADAMRQGHWLGDYTPATLSKGPLYPMYVAAASFTGVPLALAMQLTYAAIALLTVQAIRPAIRSRWLLAAAMVLLMLNPFSWGPLPARFERDTLSAHLALLLAGSAAGLVVRMRWPARQLLPWAALCGIAAAANWLIREEAIWIVGPIGVLLVGTAFVLWRERLGDRAAVVVIASAACAAAPILAVCEMNRRHYGVFAVVDTSSSSFVGAYGSLLRVGSAYHRRYVPVPAEARQALYAVSPSFARMRATIEGEDSHNWVGRRRSDGPPDIQGGWFIWAFREAAQNASGQGDRVPTEFYATLASEVNGACDLGRVPAGPVHNSVATPIAAADVPFVFDSLSRYAGQLLWWPTIPHSRVSRPLEGSVAEVSERLANTPVCGPDHLMTIAGWACAAGSLQAEAEDEEGNARRARFQVRWQDSPDVPEHLKAQGKNWPEGEHCRFREGIDPTLKAIRFMADGKELARFPLDGSADHIVRDDFEAWLTFEPAAKPVVSEWKRSFLHSSEVAYRWLSPVMTGLSLIWLATALVRRKCRDWPMVSVAITLVAAIGLRTALLAYIDATTYEIWGTRYFAPTFTVEILLGLVAVTAITRWSDRRSEHTAHFKAAVEIAS